MRSFCGPFFDHSGSIATFPSSINPAGAITGFYEDTSFVFHGFLRDPDGTITTFDPADSMATFPTSIRCHFPTKALTGLLAGLASTTLRMLNEPFVKFIASSDQVAPWPESSNNAAEQSNPRETWPISRVLLTLL
jgi:hypothetical protein